jgi:hypothetical protein
MRQAYRGREWERVGEGGSRGEDGCEPVKMVRAQQTICVECLNHESKTEVSDSMAERVREREREIKFRIKVSAILCPSFARVRRRAKSKCSPVNRKCIRRRCKCRRFEEKDSSIWSSRLICFNACEMNSICEAGTRRVTMSRTSLIRSNCDAAN